MKRSLQLAFIACSISIGMQAQVGIGTTNPNATLDISASSIAAPSNEDGILIPRVDEFPASNPTVAQDGMLLFITGNGTPIKGFYYWDQSSTNWVAMASQEDVDFYEEGTTTAPDDINDDIFHLGNIAIGKNTADYKLDISDSENRPLNILQTGTFTTVSEIARIESTISNSNTKKGLDIYMNTTGAGYQTGIYSELVPSGSAPQTALDNRIHGTNGGQITGVFTEISNTNDELQYGIYNFNNGNGTGEHYGVVNNMVARGSGNIFGTENRIFNNGNGAFYGTKNELSGDGSGARYATHNLIEGGSHANIYGTYTSLTNSGDGTHYGSANFLSGTGGANHYGYWTRLSGAGNGGQVGFFSQINNTGGATHYGALNRLEGTGTGSQFGALNLISNTGSGDHHGVRNTLIGNGTGDKYGINTIIDRTAAGNNFGVQNELRSTAGGNQIGMRNTLTSPTGSIYGMLNALTGGNYTHGTQNTFLNNASSNANYGARNNFNNGSANNERFGTRNTFSGSGSGLDNYGLYNVFNTSSGSTIGETNLGVYNQFGNNYGALNQIGVHNYFDQTTAGELKGIYNEFNLPGHTTYTSEIIGMHNSALISGFTFYGMKNELNNNGANTYGVYNNIQDAGSNVHSVYGLYNTMSGGVNTTHYGIYSNVTSNGDDYAGYFLGPVAVGTTAADTYTLPLARGTNGQVLQTDGAGNVSWVSDPWPSHWTRSGSVLYLANPTDDIRFLSDQTSITFQASTGTPAPMFYMFSSGTANANKMVLSHSATYSNYGLSYNDGDDSFRFLSSGSSVLEIDLAGAPILTVNGVTQSEEIAVGIAVPTHDITIKQSGTGQASSGGLGLISTFSTDNWKVYHSGSNLSFSENGVRRAYVEAATGNYITTSDKRLKKNIETQKDVLENVSKLEVFKYHYKDQNATAPKSIGFLAQEVQQLFPDAVKQNEEGFLGINYDYFSVLAIKAIQEQQKTIKNQAREIENLKIAIAEIKTLLKSD